MGNGPNVRVSTRVLLWAKSAGFCQYEGCDKRLIKDDLTQEEFNTAYVCHIVGSKEDGPRGDPEKSEELRDDIRNLMLLCDVHHRLVDKHDVAGHPSERLRAMKERQERRVELACGIPENKQSHILLFGAKIGEHTRLLSYDATAPALLPNRYPASKDPFELQIKGSSLEDRDETFWKVERENLLRQFDAEIRPALASGRAKHLSVFARAPQPLLMLLGTLLTDIGPVDVFQCHREPHQSWSWPESNGGDLPVFQVSRPDAVSGVPVLVVSLSATITVDRITKVLGDGVSVWWLSIPEPQHDFVRSPIVLSEFRRVARRLLDEIKAAHSHDATLHIFPAMPVSTAVELGRVRQPKADLAWQIYDQNHHVGGFAHAFDIC